MAEEEKKAEPTEDAKRLGELLKRPRKAREEKAEKA